MWCFLENNLWSTLSRHNTTTEVASFNKSICFQHHCAWARNIVNDYLLTAVISVNYDTLHFEMLVSLNYVAILGLQEAWVFQTCSIEICFPCSPSSCSLLTKWSFQISLFSRRTTRLAHTDGNFWGIWALQGVAFFHIWPLLCSVAGDMLIWYAYSQ